MAAMWRCCEVPRSSGPLRLSSCCPFLDTGFQKGDRHGPRSPR